MKKKCLVTVLAGLMTLAMSMTAFAAGWQQDNTGWRYDNGDGTWAHTGWFWLDGNNDGVAECYYFDDNGYMLANTTTPDGFPVNANGAWEVDGIVMTTGLSKQPVQTEETQTANEAQTGDAAQVTDNGGYNSYGCSNVALEMLKNSREENAKYGEVSVLEQAGGTYVIYANGFGVAYPDDGTGYYRTVQVDRSDLDNTYLFKHFVKGLNAEQAAKMLQNKGFEKGINGTYANGVTCWVEVGSGGTLNWIDDVLVLR